MKEEREEALSCVVIAFQALPARPSDGCGRIKIKKNQHTLRKGQGIYIFCLPDC
jgi:hypothetical protein